MDSMRSMTIDKFMQALAAKAPVPGGGGAAALAGALGAALCAMVGNYTIGKKKYVAVEADICAMLEKSEALSQRFLALVEADAAAFEPLSNAYAIPKDDPDRETVMENALVIACETPIEIMRCCCEAIELLEEMGEKGSSMLLSDVGVGAELCRAALCSAHLNVLINVKSMQDTQRKMRYAEESASRVAEYGKRAEAVALRVREILAGEGSR